MKRTARLTLIVSFLLTAVILCPARPQASEPRWSLVKDMFKNQIGLGIACLGETVHLVWNRGQKLYWSYSQGGDSWSQPEVLSVRSGGTLDLVSDGRMLHLAWPQSTNIGYRTFDGDSWSGEERILKEPAGVGGPSLVLTPGGPVVFWCRYQHGSLPHTPGSWPLLFSRRGPDGWSEPAPVPCADNVRDAFTAAAGPDGAVMVAWVQNHMGYLGRNFGFSVGKPRRTVEAATFDPAAGKCGSSEHMATLTRDGSRELHMTADSSGAVHLLWIDGYHLSRAEWSTYAGGAWTPARTIKSAHGGAMEADLVAAGGGVTIFTYSSEKSSNLCVILEAGTPREHTHFAPSDVRMWLQGVRVAVSPSGVVHAVSDGGDYCRFVPARR